MFVPDTSRYHFPEDTSAHYLKVKMDRGIVFDKNYPYVDKSFSFRFKRFWVRLLLRIIVFPLAKIRFGIRIYGKVNIKQHKRLLANGAITIANHVFMWDYICIMKAVHNFKWPYLLSWDKNVNGDSGPLVRMVGGIPIPENDNEATLAFMKDMKQLLDEGNFLQIYPEGSMWEYYSRIRPFKRGAASFAIKNNKPILPMAFSYRKPSWFRRKLFHQLALVNLSIGEPILPNSELERTAQVDDLTRRAFEAVCKLSKFGDHNIYEAIYNNSRKKGD